MRHYCFVPLTSHLGLEIDMRSYMLGFVVTCDFVEVDVLCLKLSWIRKSSPLSGYVDD